MKLADAPPVKEQITDEERYMFQKLGLRMRARLLLGKLVTKCGTLLSRFWKYNLYSVTEILKFRAFRVWLLRGICALCAGRRGVFDGTVENMHLHWKYRELVKIIFKGPLFEAERTAKILEVESGGVLVGIVATSKGHAIIFYRGKHYERPSELRPRHLLTKRQALQRSLEMQRKHVSSHRLRLFRHRHWHPSFIWTSRKYCVLVFMHLAFLSNVALLGFRIWSDMS